MRWSEIVEGEGVQSAEQKAAKERRRQEELSGARRAKADAARKYQSEMQKANAKLNRAS